MMEELVLDRATGRIANASLMDYKIPSSEDVPAEMMVSYVETAQTDGPLGARGIGEHTMIPTPAAVANALFDACGIRIKEMPITAEKVLEALKAKTGFRPQASGFRQDTEAEETKEEVGTR
jgi:CO/xanthine dehydrogenase Mo-binding subunit